MANQYRSITPKGIESIFRVLIAADPRIERFRLGDYASSETQEDVYPLVLLDFLGSRIERKATLQYNRWDIRLECYGMRRSDGANTTDVFSETHVIMNDLILRFIREQDLIDMGFIFDNNISRIDYIVRNDRDDLIGVRVDLTFLTPLMQCADDFPVDALPDLGLYYSAATLSAGSQYLTCATLTGCTVIQTIQQNIEELYTLTGGTGSFDCADLLGCDLFLDLSGQTQSLSSITQTHTTQINQLYTLTGGTSGGAFLPLSGGTGGTYYFTGTTLIDGAAIGTGGLRLDYVLPNGVAYVDQTGTIRTDPGEFYYDPTSNTLTVGILSGSSIFSGGSDLQTLFSRTGHTHVSANITDSSYGGNGYADSDKLLKFSVGGGILLNSDNGPALYATSTEIFGGEVISINSINDAAGLRVQTNGAAIDVNSRSSSTIYAYSEYSSAPVIHIENYNTGNTADLAHFHNSDNLGLEIQNDGTLRWTSATGSRGTTDHLSVFNSSQQGVVPASGGGTVNFLRADGQWTAPPSGSTFVQPGTNITTGGTASAPVISVVGSPVFTGVTSQTMSATSFSATTIFSGGSDVSTLFAPASVVATRVQPGTNTTTGGTASAPVVNVVDDPSFTTVAVSGEARASVLTGTVSVFGNSVSATTFFSGSTPLSTILSSLGGGTPTRVQPGTNITTGGTASAPVVNVVGSPTFTGVTSQTMSATSFSAETIFSGGSDLQTLFASTSHTHTSSQISDSTVAGRALLTASTASDQRTSLGLGTAAVLNEVSVSDTSGQATSSASYIDLTGISASMAASTLYAVELLVMAEVSSTSGSVNISLNGSTAASYVTMHFAGLQAAGNINIQNINTYDWTASMPTGVAAANSVYLCRISALILNGGSTSTLSGRIRRGGTTGTVTVRGAYMKVRRL